MYACKLQSIMSVCTYVCKYIRNKTDISSVFSDVMKASSSQKSCRFILDMGWTRQNQNMPEADGIQEVSVVLYGRHDIMVLVCMVCSMYDTIRYDTIRYDTIIILNDDTCQKFVFIFTSSL